VTLESPGEGVAGLGVDTGVGVPIPESPRGVEWLLGVRIGSQTREQHSRFSDGECFKEFNPGEVLREYDDTGVPGACSIGT